MFNDISLENRITNITNKEKEHKYSTNFLDLYSFCFNVFFENYEKEENIESYEARLSKIKKIRKCLDEFYVYSKGDEEVPYENEFFTDREPLTFSDLEDDIESTNMDELIIDYRCRNISCLYYKYCDQKRPIKENVIDHFIRLNCNKNITTSKDNNVLHAATRKENITACKILVEKGVEINAVNNNGETPLIIAGKQGNMEIISFLLDHGARCSDKYTYMPFPVLSDNYLLALKMYDGIINPCGEPDVDSGETALHIITRNVKDPQDAVFQFVLNNAEDINVPNREGVSAYGIACKNLNFPIINEYTKFAKENDISLIGDDPNVLFFMIRSDAKEFVNKCKDEYISTKNELYQNPLIYACRYNRTEIFFMLAPSFFFYYNDVDYDERSALHYACMNKNYKIADYLMSRGGNEYLKDYQGNTPLYYLENKSEVD